MSNLPSEEIKKLLNQIAEGNDKAFKSFYLRYQPILARFVRYQVLDESAVEEIINDTFMVICKKPDGYDGTSKFSTWLCGIALNKCKDWRRKNSRQFFSEVVDDEVINSIPDDSMSILQALEHQERDEVIRECIRKLPPTQREAISMFLLTEEKVEIISEMQNCPAGTVKTRLMHARLKIKECVKNALGERS